MVATMSILLLSNCTDNERVRAFGGTQTIDLSLNKKLIDVTWKQNDLWILTRDAVNGDIQEQYSFKEKSSFGLIEGEMIIKESFSETSSSTTFKDTTVLNNGTIFEQHPITTFKIDKTR